jgi:cytochrome bd ubiquinol oxidase subunit I
MTIGLAAFLVVLEGAWLRTGEAIYFTLYKFWSKLFALAFGIGVVTGLVLSYEFGTNWSRFSAAAGNVIGPLMGYEVLTAFFLEAGFLGIMLFGLERVGRRLHFLATCMVSLGTLISMTWILSANSWMHTPAGYAIVGGTFHVTDWWAVILNPSFPYRLAHMATAAFLSAAMGVAGVSAWYLLQARHQAFAQKGFSLAMWMVAVAAPAQVVIGDLHGLNTIHHQPMKVAAMEGHWETSRGIPMLLFAIPDQAAATNRYEIGIPRLGSLILTHAWDGEVKGLHEVPAEDRPPVAIVFYAFRVMVGIGLLLAAIGLLGLWLRWRGRLYTTPLYLRLVVASSPLGFVAILAGWAVTEVGRQPWTVYGHLRTADSVSPVAAGAVASSLALFVLAYSVLVLAFLLYA